MPERKVMVSGSLDPEVFAALEKHCRANPHVSRSQVMNRAVRQFLLPDYQEARQRVVAETLDRLVWQQHNQAKGMAQEQRKLYELVMLLARTFYYHIPEVPAGERPAAVASGDKRFHRFLAVLAENAGDGPSPLQLMPQPIEGANVTDAGAGCAADDDTTGVPVEGP